MKLFPYDFSRNVSSAPFKKPWNDWPYQKPDLLRIFSQDIPASKSKYVAGGKVYDLDWKYTIIGRKYTIICWK